MKEFPNKLRVENKDQFATLHYERTKCYLRRDLYEHIIGRDESDYFDLEKFNRKRLRNMELMSKMTGEIIEELEALGWKCGTSFGGTGLFISSTDEMPPNFFPDGIK